ncbi:hypothetical protein FNH22_13155 [Fulvivirga sp. M361]|uniref:hypothetical protein n=1 Tax=Fulvivirga sp. M361 TaxID=2594266 RepID=UPI00117B15CF|nr:hypothetical protein [Fulvivirga sp. M361]TRX58816.1 hypothetical protein FNH22_13155 [Fulvivirga sp. M361]
MNNPKRILSVVLVILLMTNALLVPFIYLDFNLRKDFIARVLCRKKEEPITVCGGSCYLKEQLRKVTEPQGTETNRHKSTPETFFYYEKITPIKYSTHLFSYLFHRQKHHHSYYTSHFLSAIFRPPRSYFFC